MSTKNKLGGGAANMRRKGWTFACLALGCVACSATAEDAQVVLQGEGADMLGAQQAAPSAASNEAEMRASSSDEQAQPSSDDCAGCADSEPSTVCADGFVDCNGRAEDGCEVASLGLPSVPRLVSPMHGEYTGSAHSEAALRPRLFWSAPSNAGSCGALTYEVQIDDSCERHDAAGCSFPSPEVDAVGISETAWATPTSLPVQRAAPAGATYFWRVRACEAPGRCSAWSESRYLNVGRLRDDLNGDGYSELVALSMDGESPFRVLLVEGGSSAATRPSVALESKYDAFGDARFVGDVNGDGFMDAVRVQPSSAQGVGSALIFGAANLADVSELPLPETTAFRAASAVGDANADGFDDFAISAYMASSTGADASLGVQVHFGAQAPNLEQPLVLTPPPGTTSEEFGNELEGGFDLDADGYADLGVIDGDDGRIHIVRGGTPEPRIDLSLDTLGPCRYYAGAKLTRAGDMTGDGVSELAARCDTRMLVYRGARSPELQPFWKHEVGDVGFSGPDISGGHDLGEDGLADLVFYAWHDDRRRLEVLPGSDALSPTSEAIDFGGNMGERRPGEGLTSGDYDGDGRRDVVVNTAFYPVSLLRFLGGRVTTNADPCAQASSSFETVGNWCSAVAEEVTSEFFDSYAGYETNAGTAFGHVLAR